MKPGVQSFLHYIGRSVRSQGHGQEGHDTDARDDHRGRRPPTRIWTDNRHALGGPSDGCGTDMAIENARSQELRSMVGSDHDRPVLRIYDGMASRDGIAC